MNKYDLKINHQLIARLMKGFIVSNGYTLRQCADHFDMSYTVIKRLADGKGDREPGMRILLILSDIFNVRLNDFFIMSLNKSTRCTFETKYDLLKAGYDDLVKENNLLLFRNNELESKLLQEV